MDLPDCPPGAEGYEDTVVEMPRKPDEHACTKAEQEFQEHIASLKIHVDDGTTRCMVERRGRDISGKWIYLCYPCAAVCSGEGVLQTHISGKKHKGKLGQKDPWPASIFTQHPVILSEKGEAPANSKTEATGPVLKKMAEEVDLYNTKPSELNIKYNKFREATCHLQETLDNVKTPLLGLEYLVEHPPEESHHEPTYMCSLCVKQGHPRTIINHLTCFWHRYHYIMRHFPKACALLNPYRSQPKYREGVGIVMTRLVQRIEDKYGRLRPVNIDKELFDREKDQILQWLTKSFHFSEKPGATFEEVVDIDLINSLSSDPNDAKGGAFRGGNKREFDSRKRDPSPPVVAAPTKPFQRNMRARRTSPDSLSDISLEDAAPQNPHRSHGSSQRYEPYPQKHNASSNTSNQNAFRPWYERKKNPEARTDREIQRESEKRSYKVKLTTELREKIELSSKKMLQYHEKNPEKHPLYPEEWKKFWNRRYKEIQAEGKDPSKYDFKPEWITFWTARMKELHDEELKVHVNELYRKMCLTPPDMTREEDKRRDETPRWSPHRRSPGTRRREPEPRRPEPRRKSPEPRRRSPEPRRRSPEPRRRTPEPHRRSPIPRRPDSHRRSPPRRRSPERRPSPGRRPHSIDYRRELRSPPRPLERHHEPPRTKTRSRSPVRPVPSRRSPARTHITLESARRSRSPLSVRAAAQLRNRSPAPAAQPPSLQTVMVSDDELKPDDDLSPWNSERSLESLGSLPDARSPPRSRSRTASEASRRTHYGRSCHPQSSSPYKKRKRFPTIKLESLGSLPDARSPPRSRSRTASEASRRTHYGRSCHPQDLGPPENIVATLRLLVALEDYLGSIGPKIVDLLTEALKMEKERANSSEELLVRDSAVVLIETAKEKLKGAVQAGLVPPGAAAAVRGAVVRAAATLHAADTKSRTQLKEQQAQKAKGMPVAGVGEVDRAQIAEQMAAALIAQGKTDVSSEELAQLVDAVVGMAEAKKREAAEKSRVVERVVEKPKPAPAPSGTATALQMLQSAYDENDKRIEPDAAPDAMDGLSDSDLETLLKNFNELSAEEQHSLIAYLKKLEARSPQRVERLRQYVSAAAATGPGAASGPGSGPAADPDSERAPDPEPAPPVPSADPKLAPVTIESDDDDYTVEEVFKSATEKVKENQIRQEMEIVKKSLEESKTAPAVSAFAENANISPAPKVLPTVDLTANFSSATDLLALVQASIQSTAKVTPTSSETVDVVASTNQPRSFGDRSEPATNQPSRPLPVASSINPPQQFGNQQANLQRPPPNFQNTNDSYNNDTWSNQTQGNPQDNRSFMPNRGPMQDNRGPPMNDYRPMQDNRPKQGGMQDNRGHMQGGPMQDNRPMQGGMHGGAMQGDMQDNRGPMHGGPMQGGPMQGSSMQGGPMQGGPMQDNRPMQGGMHGGPMQGGMQDNRGPMQGQMQDNRGMMQNNRPPYMQGNRPFMPVNSGQNMQNRPPLISAPPVRPQGNYGSDPYNQGPRGNFMNGRMDMNQQQNNYRGRGRGNYGGGPRGRGRGYY